MTIAGTIQSAISVGGLTMNGSISVAEENCLSIDTSLAAAQSGTLSTRSSDTAGTLTLSADHGITDGQVIDIYWSTGQCYSATVGTVAGTSVPFTGASGDVLPVQTTAITTSVVTELTAAFDFDEVKMAATMCTQKANLVFWTSAPSEIAVGGADNLELTANQPWSWADGSGIAAPATGTSATITVSNGGTSAATFKLAVLFNGVV